MRIRNRKGTKERPVFESALLALADSGDYMLKIYLRGSGPKGRYIDTIEPSLLLDDGNVEEFLKRCYGGGDFEVVIVDTQGVVSGKYLFEIGGLLREQYLPLAGDGKKTVASGDDSTLVTLFAELAKAAINKGTDGGDLDKVAALMQAIKASESELIGKLTETLLGTVFNAAGGGSNIGDMRELLALARELNPAVEGQDTLTAILSNLPSLYMLLKGGQVPGALLAQAPQAAVPVAPQALAAPGQGNTQPMQRKAQETGVRPPGPAGADEDEGEKSKPPDEEAQLAFGLLFLKPFYQDVESGVAPDKLAGQFLELVSVAISRLDSPPPILAELIAALDTTDLEIISASFDRFWSSVPSLQGKTEIRDGVKAYLVQLLMSLPERPEAQDEEAEPVTQNQATGEIADGHN